MVTLIPDFARAMTESNRRASASVDAEVRRIETLRERAENLLERHVGWNTLRRHVTREARAATHNIVAVADEVAELWSSAVDSLRNAASVNDQIEILHAFCELTASGRELFDSINRLWVLVGRLDGPKDEMPGLAEAGRVIDRVHSESARARECRTTPWQPSDPARYERGKQEIQDGKALSPIEVLRRVRKQPD